MRTVPLLLAAGRIGVVLALVTHLAHAWDAPDADDTCPPPRTVAACPDPCPAVPACPTPVCPTPVCDLHVPPPPKIVLLGPPYRDKRWHGTVQKCVLMVAP